MNVDQIQRILPLIGVARNRDRDRFTDVAHLADRQRRMKRNVIGW